MCTPIDNRLTDNCYLVFNQKQLGNGLTDNLYQEQLSKQIWKT